MSRSFAFLTAFAAATALLLSPAAANDGASALKRAPKNPVAVVHLDFQKLKKSKIIRELLDQVRRNPKTMADIEKIKKEVGFDVFEDLHAITFVLPEDFAQGNRLLMVVDAKFDPAKLKAAALKETGLKPKTYAGVEYFAPPNSMAFAAVSKRVLLVADEANMKRALDQKGDLSAFIKGVDRSKDVWFSGRVTPALVASAPKEAQQLEAFEGTLSVAAGLEVLLKLSTKDAGFAKKMAALATAQINQGKAQPQMAMMGLAAVLNSMSVTADGKIIHGRLKIGEPDLLRIVAMMKMMIGMGSAMQGQKMPAPVQKMPAPAKK